MTDKEPLPVAGYTAQSDAKIALVNEFKADEERLLRKIDALEKSGCATIETTREFSEMYQNLFEARHYFKVGFMLLNRAVFQPQRIKLPEDEP